MTEQRIIRDVIVRLANGSVTVISEVASTHHEAAMKVLRESKKPIVAYAALIDDKHVWQDIPER